jgi:hypothetical protein
MFGRQDTADPAKSKEFNSGEPEPKVDINLARRSFSFTMRGASRLVICWQMDGDKVSRFLLL